METLEEKLKENKIKNLLLERSNDKDVEEIAQELKTISQALIGNYSKQKTIRKLEEILQFINKKTKLIIQKTINPIFTYLTNFYPSTNKLLSSIIQGSTTSLLMDEFLQQYSINPKTSHLFYIGIITSALSYNLQSIYQKKKIG